MAVDKEEVRHFSSHADSWWDSEGSFAPLHHLNPLRLGYIRETMDAHFGLEGDEQPFSRLKLLDLGCGGGLLSEPMARLGAEVTGLDASAETIEIARAHAKKEGLPIDYRAGDVSALASLKNPPLFDVILCMELLEHVPSVPSFLEETSKLLSPSGLLFLSTINRTPKSFALAIIGLEYVLRWIPRGTHHYEKFITPDELRAALEGGGLFEKDITGVVFNPLSASFGFSRDVSVNYMAVAEKRESA